MFLKREGVFSKTNVDSLLSRTTQESSLRKSFSPLLVSVDRSSSLKEGDQSNTVFRVRCFRCKVGSHSLKKVKSTFKNK